MADQVRRSKLTRRHLLRSAAGAGASAIGTTWMHDITAAPQRAPLQIGARFLPAGELTFAAIGDDLAKIQPLLDEYGQNNNVKITTVPTSYADLYAKLNINLTQSTGAYDVVSIDDPWMPLFAGGGYLKNLSEMIDKLGIEPHLGFVPEFWALGEVPLGAGLSGFPWIGNVQVFAWRSDILPQFGKDVPATWDDILTLAAEVTKAMSGSDLYGFGLRGKAGHDAATSFLPVLWGFGQNLLDPVTSEPRLETPEAMSAIDLHVKVAKLAPKGVETTTHGENGANLATGRIAMSADIWPDQLFQVFDPERSEVAGNIEVGLQPAQFGVRPKNMTGNWLLGIPEESKNADLALDFILWLTADAQQRRLLLDRIIAPTRLAVLDDPEAVEQFPFLTDLLTAARNAVPRPRTPLYPSLEAIYGRFVAEAVAGQTDAGEAMTRANQEMRDLLIREGVIE